MALVSTPAASNANSFASMDELDDILAGHLYSSAWFDAANESKKEPAAITATRILNSLRFTGVPSTSTQALQFPMEGLYRYGDAYLVATKDESDAYINPPEIKLAQAEYARLLMIGATGEGGGEDITVESDIAKEGISKIKAGSVELGFFNLKQGSKYTDSANPLLSSIPKSVLDLIPMSWLYAEVEGKSIIFEVA